MQIINMSIRKISEIALSAIRVCIKIIMAKRTNKSEVIAASEISQYVYCPVSWYLKRMGASPRSPYLERGIREHIGAGKRLSLLQKKDSASRAFRFLEYSSALFAILLIGWFLRQNF